MSDVGDAEVQHSGGELTPERLLATFDGQYPGFDAWAVGRARKMEDRLILFGIGLLCGVGQSHAAKLAGFPQSKPASLSGKASRAAKTERMKGFLAAARQHRESNRHLVAKAPELTDARKLEMYAEMAESPDPNVRRIGLAGHTALKNDIDKRNPAQTPGADDFNPHRFCDAFYAVDPCFEKVSIALAEALGISWTPPGTERDGAGAEGPSAHPVAETINVPPRAGTKTNDARTMNGHGGVAVA